MFARKKFLTMLFIALALIVGVGVAWAGKGFWRRTAPESPAQLTAQKLPRSVKRRTYVRRGGLWPKLRWNLRALGDRLENPGKEQMVVQGALTRAGVASAPVALNIDAPNRMTLRMQLGIQSHSVSVDDTASSRKELSESDRGLVDTLLSDSAENFFISQMNGAATRCLGVRARLSEKDEPGPFYDIYAVTPLETSTVVTGAKLFYFNSDTLMLDLVRYQVESRNGPVQVEVRLSQWQDVAGQNVPRRIDRLENGTVVMTLVINSAMFAPDTPVGKL